MILNETKKKEMQKGTKKKNKQNKTRREKTIASAHRQKD